MAEVPVAAGAGDNAAGAVGIGAVEPGRGYLALGTSGVLYLATDRFPPAPQAGLHHFAHAVPNRWQVTGVILSAASALDWSARAAGFLGVDDALNAAAEAELDRETFLPYLSGERSPINDPLATGVLFGLSHRTSPGSIVRACLEGVAFAFADCAERMRAGGADVAALTLIGGGAASGLWARLIAAAIGIPLLIREGSEHASAIGAARLAMMMDGIEPRAAAAQPAVLAEFRPEPQLADAIAPRRADFRRLYPALKPVFA